MAQTPSLTNHFPSLLRALEHLKLTPYDAGWILGCISHISTHLIPWIVLGAPVVSVDTVLETAAAHLCERGAVDRDTPFGAADEISVTELIVFLRHICEHYLSHRREIESESASRSLWRERFNLVVEVEQRVDDWLWEAAIETLCDGRPNDRMELIVEGWNDCKYPGLSFNRC
jgi:hypothetical protein